MHIVATSWIWGSRELTLATSRRSISSILQSPPQLRRLFCDILSNPNLKERRVDNEEVPSEKVTVRRRAPNFEMPTQNSTNSRIPSTSIPSATTIGGLLRPWQLLDRLIRTTTEAFWRIVRLFILARNSWERFGSGKCLAPRQIKVGLPVNTQ